MKRATIAAATGIGLALAFAHPWAPGEWTSQNQVYLPRVGQRFAPPPIDVPVPRTTLRPATAGALIDALAVPRALVLPEPGEFWMPVQARVAAGVTLNGRGAVSITGRGLMLDRADDASILGVTIRDCKGDCLTVQHSRRVVFERLDVSRATDGLFDMNGGATVTVRDSLFHDGTPRGVLVGNWQAGSDGRERLILERVTFRDVPVRTPKLQDADLIARDLAIIRPTEWGLDLRGSSTADITGLVIVPGKKTNPPGWRADHAAHLVIR